MDKKKALEIVQAYGWELQNLPDDFGSLQELKILDLGYKYIPSIPESFTDLINLEYN